MNSNPKIVVFQLKELIYTIIFVILAILLILLLVFMFLHDKDTEETDASYNPGTYASSLTIGSIPVEVSVKVDSERIVDVTLSPIGDSVETIFPLLESSIDTMKKQIISTQSLDNVYLTSDSQYTYTVLMDAIRTALDKAVISD